MLPKISVIIPLYNHHCSFIKSLLSLAKQTYKNLEIIVINDGSEDITPSELELLEAKFKFKLFNQANQGASAARNAGWQQSSGDYVIFWDADTLAKPEFISKLYSALENQLNASYAYSSYKFGCKTMPAKQFSAEDLKQNNYIDTTSLIRRSALLPLLRKGEGGGEVSGPFDENLKRFQDWDLWLALLEQNKTGIFVPEVLFKKLVGLRQGISTWLPKIFYRLSPNSSSVRAFTDAKNIVLKKHRL